MQRTYNAMMLPMDEASGRVIDKLRRADLEQDTLIFFCSDNGGPTVHRYAYNASKNTPLRGSKGTTLEGGIRVPFVMSWKGHLPAGTVYDPQVIQLDFLPTALAVAGVEVKPEWKLDGVNLLPHLKGEASAPPHDVLYWRSIGQTAVRKGDWKLVTYMSKIDEGDVHRSELPPPTAPRLYNLSTDIGETNDLASSETEKFNELKSLWDEWNANMDQSPQIQHTTTNNRAPLILRRLDADKDGKISKSEAIGGIKENFSLIDANGDGGIDLEELTGILNNATTQPGR